MKNTWMIALLFSMSTAALAQVDASRTVAIINGDEVKGGEYYRRMEFLPGVYKPMGRSFGQFPPGFLTLEQLITEKLVLQLAKQKGVSPTDMEVEAELKARLADTPDLLKEWTATGRSPDELKYQIRYELAQFKVATFGITITDQEVEKHFNENPASYNIPKQAKLRVIVVDSAAARTTVDRELAAGKEFAEVAKAHSIDLTKTAGGDYGTVPVPYLNTPVRDAINAIKIGQSTGWINTKVEDDKDAWLRFLLVDMEPEKKVTLDTKLRRNIRRQLMLGKGGVKNDIAKEMAEIRQKAKIDIKEPEFADAYKKFIEAYLKQGG